MFIAEAVTGASRLRKKLIEAGYTNVFDFGGINDWPYETVSGNEDKKDGTEAAREDGTEAEPSFSHFTATDLDGNTVTEDIFKDYKLTMINIWGTFCWALYQRDA